MSVTATSTGEFHPGIGKQSVGSAVLPVGNTLYHLSPAEDERLQIGMGDLSELIATGDLEPITQGSHWQVSKVSSNIINANGANFKSSHTPALALYRGRLYLFWADTHSSGQVYAAYLDLSTNTWSPVAYTLQVSSSSTLKVSSTLSAITINGKLRLSWFTPGTLTLDGTLLDPDLINPADHSWQYSPLSSVDLIKSGLSVDKGYYTMSADWFSQGNIGNAMVAAFYSTDKSEVQSLVVPLNPDGSNSSDKPAVALNSFSSRKGSAVARDPSGQIFLIHGSKDDSDVLYWRTLGTFQDFGDGGVHNWSDDTKFNGHSTKSMPSACFVFGPQSPSTLSMVGRDGQSSSLPCTQIKTYRFVFYSRENKSDGSYDTKSQGDFYGYSKIVPDYSEQVPGPSLKDFFTLSNILDPFPFPNQNVGSAQPGDTMVSYTYGTSSATEASATAAWNLSFGIRSDLTTTKGIGPAYEAEFKAGPSGSEATTHKASTFEGVTIDTALVAEKPGDPSSSVVVSPQGRAEGVSMPTVVETSSLFFDASGRQLSGTVAPYFSSLSPVIPRSSPGLDSSLYDVICSTPGDLSTYSEDAINARMAALYESLDPDVREAYFPDGYASNYLEDVILPHAITIQGERKFLLFQVSPNGTHTSNYSEVDTKALTSGWSLQTSLYVGAGYGEEASIFGFGEAFSGKTLGGFSFELAVTHGVNQQEGWGVTTGFSYPDNVPGALSYSVQMYICRSSNLWARELQYMGANAHQAATIDWDSSRPMKVIFVVQGYHDAR